MDYKIGKLSLKVTLDMYVIKLGCQNAYAIVGITRSVVYIILLIYINKDKISTLDGKIRRVQTLERL